MDQDKRLFAEQMVGVKPLASENRIDKATVRHNPSLAQLARRKAALHGCDELVLELSVYHPAHDPLCGHRDGIQAGVLRKLRLGQYQIDARLDLANQAPSAALDELLRFVDESRRYEVRTALITHGRGAHDQAKGNLLRSFLALWLPQIKQVQAFHSAQPHHGGLAATYLLLEKSERARESNREQQRRGRS